MDLELHSIEIYKCKYTAKISRKVVETSSELKLKLNIVNVILLLAAEWYLSMQTWSLWEKTP